MNVVKPSEFILDETYLLQIFNYEEDRGTETNIRMFAKYLGKRQKCMYFRVNARKLTDNEFNIIRDELDSGTTKMDEPQILQISEDEIFNEDVFTTQLALQRGYELMPVFYKDTNMHKKFMQQVSKGLEKNLPDDMINEIKGFLPPKRGGKNTRKRRTKRKIGV